MEKKRSEVMLRTFIGWSSLSRDQSELLTFAGRPDVAQSSVNRAAARTQSTTSDFVDDAPANSHGKRMSDFHPVEMTSRNGVLFA